MKTLLIGWDAADWRAIDPLLAEGKMPNLQRLLNQGVRGNIATLNPILSPMLWSSIATGKRPYKHGVHGFSEPDPITGAIRPVTNLSRKCKAIWNILNQNAKHTITVGWWPSNPAEPLSRGVMVSNNYQRSTALKRQDWTMPTGTVHPERLTEKLKELRFHPEELNADDFAHFIPAIVNMDEEERNKLEKDPRLQSLGKIIADCTSIHSAATALMQNEPWDLMSVYYDAIDHFEQGFMKYHPPQRPQIDDWDYKMFHYCVEAGYRYHDMLLGTLMNLAGEDTNIILISDHGFHPDALRLDSIPNEPAGPAIEHRELGIFAAKGPQFKQGATIYGARLLDICPTLLHLFDLPIAKDMDGKVLLDLYKEKPKQIMRIPSWEDIEGDHGMHSSDQTISPEDAKAALDQLVALGYIDEPNADQSKALEQTVRELDYNLAQAYMDGGIYIEALIILERLYEKWPLEHRFGIKLSICYQALYRNKEQQALIAQIIERRMDQAEQAIAKLKKIGLDTEEGVKAHQDKMDAMEKKEQQQYLKEQKELFAHANPNFYNLHMLEATADISTGDFSLALKKLEQLSEHHGERHNTLVLRGKVLARLKRWEEAEKAYLSGLELEPESSSCLMGLGRLAMVKKDFHTAIKHLQAALEIVYANPKAHYMLGISHLRLGNYSSAETCFTLCLQQAPLFPPAWRALGQIAQFHYRDPHQTVFYKQQVKEARSRLKQMALEKKQQRVKLKEEFTERQPMPKLIPDTMKLNDIDEKQIITIVSGLPRSGTSLMMQVLEAADINCCQDGKRKADDSNQKGYYEHESVMKLMEATPAEKNWVSGAKGQALKVVAPLLSFLPIYDQLEEQAQKKSSDHTKNAAKKLHYRVIFMERPMEEVMHSQSTMLKKLDKAPPKGNPIQGYRQQVRAAKNWLIACGIPAISIDYADLVHQPENTLPKLVDFLGCPEKCKQMQAVIDPSMHRSKMTTLASSF